ncbi:hypothetical protein ACHAWF_002627 [Thalassiosira exigua]
MTDNIRRLKFGREKFPPAPRPRAAYRHRQRQRQRRRQSLRPIAARLHLGPVSQSRRVKPWTKGRNPGGGESGVGRERSRERGALNMSTQDPPSSDVELTSLIGAGGNGGCDLGEADAVVLSAVQTEGEVSTEESAGQSSGCSGRDALLFLLSIASGILAVLALVMMMAFSGESRIGEPGEARGAGGGGDALADDAFPLDASWARANLRWTPLPTDDNCVGPHFRLANSSLRCGVDPVVAPDGTRYCAGVKLVPGECMLPREGTWATPSTEGPVPPLPGRFGAGNSTEVRPRCETVEEVSNGTAEESGEWVPNTCSLAPLSPFSWTQHSGCQTTITMMGDSHIRNLFTATLNGLRGVESFAEAHASAEVKARGIVEIYDWRLMRDGSATDRVVIYTGTSTNEHEPFEDCPCDRVRKCLRVAFIWAPRFAEQLNQMHLVQELNPDLVIVEPGNSYESEVALSPEWAAKFDELLRDDAHLQLGLLHFVWGQQPAERPAVLREWTTNATYADRKSYLRQDAIQLDILQGRKTFHFACGLGKVDVENDIIHAAEPCTDATDTAQIRALVTIHFSALTMKTGPP